jgi:hypothetical protein
MMFRTVFWVILTIILHGSITQKTVLNNYLLVCYVQRKAQACRGLTVFAFSRPSPYRPNLNKILSSKNSKNSKSSEWIQSMLT